MSATHSAIVARGPFHGVAQIVRFNWPFYVVAATVIAVSVPVIGTLPVSGRVHGVLNAALALAAFWIVGSLVTSWLVYDRSTLLEGQWIANALKPSPTVWINIHAGLDDTSPMLRSLFAGSRGRVFDIFDPVDMSEPSIARARRLARNAIVPESVDYRQLPVATATIDAALLILSAHELRTDEARLALFAEVRRVLTSSGCVVVAEHLRDCANFVAFGPGFLHFHSRRTWKRCFTQAGFAVRQEFSITPFVRVFILGGSCDN